MRRIHSEEGCPNCEQLDSLFEEGLNREALAVDDSLLAELYLNRLIGYTQIGDFEGCLKFYNQHKNVLDSEQLQKQIGAEVNYSLGSSHYYAGRYDSAVIAYEKAASLYLEREEFDQYAYCMNNLAICYSYNGERIKEIETLQNLLDWQTKQKDSTAIFNTKVNLALTYYDSKLLDKAESLLLDALESARVYGTPKHEAYAITNLANIYADRGNPDTAITMYKHALKILEEQDEALENQAYNGIASCFADQNRFDSASIYYRLAFKQDYRFVDPYAMVYTAINLSASLYETGKDLDFADSVTAVYLPQAKQYQMLDMLATANMTLGSSAIRKRKYDEAERHFMKALSYKDSLRVSENDQLIADLEVKYEVQKKERELDVLKGENQLKEEIIERKNLINIISIAGTGVLILLIIVILYNQRRLQRANKKLSEQEGELRTANDHLQILSENRERMIATIAHDLRGPLSGVNQLLDMAREPDSKEEVQELLEMSHSASKTTYALLENLLEWAREKQGMSRFKPENQKLREAVSDIFMIYDYIARKKSIRLENHVSDSTEVFADIYMLETILRNLIHNALKFTGEKGEISVTADEKPEAVRVEVRDTGVGMDANRIRELFDTKGSELSVGTNKERGTGFGLRLCKDLVLKHKGKIWVESEKGRGTSFFFELPKK